MQAFSIFLPIRKIYEIQLPWYSQGDFQDLLFREKTSSPLLAVHRVGEVQQQLAVKEDTGGVSVSDQGSSWGVIASHPCNSSVSMPGNVIPIDLLIVMGCGVPATPQAQQNWTLIELLKYFYHLKAAWLRSSPRTAELEVVAFYPSVGEQSFSACRTWHLDCFLHTEKTFTCICESSTGSGCTQATIRFMVNFLFARLVTRDSWVLRR